MGFQGRLIKVRFDESSGLGGLEVDLTAMTVGESIELGEGRHDGETSKEAIRRRMAILVRHVRRWTFEDENGEPVPRTVDGVLSCDSGAVLEVVEAWMSGGRVNRNSPLGDSSTNGSHTERSSEVEASLPTESL